MRIIVHIEQVVVESDQIWPGGADALASRTGIELTRLIAQTGTPPGLTALPRAVALPRVSATSEIGESIPRQLGIALQRVLDEVSE